MRAPARLVIFTCAVTVGAVGFLAAQGQAPAAPAQGQGGAPGGGRPGGPGGGGGQQAAPTNLKVLPKAWTRQQVGALMNTFVVSLGQQAPAQGAPAPPAGQGEGCRHCHVEGAPGARGPQLDYAKDDNPNKDIARKMIEMVMKINETTKDVGDKAVVEKVTCWSCHQGKSKPTLMPEAGWGRGGFSLLPAGPPMPPPPAGRGAN